MRLGTVFQIKKIEVEISKFNLERPFNSVSLIIAWMNSILYIMNYRFLTTVVFLQPEELFVVTVQIFVYNCVFQKKEKNTHETFHILKTKTHFEKEPHFENGSSFQNTF